MLEIANANKEGLNNDEDNQELSSNNEEILTITKGKGKGKGKAVKESLKEQSNRVKGLLYKLVDAIVERLQISSPLALCSIVYQIP